MKKATMIAGVLSDRVHTISTTNTKLVVTAYELERTFVEDIERGLVPTLFVGTVGTTGTTAVENLMELGKVCQKYGVWFHVDAAYAGAYW
jgi:aromatic-L-amino-acid decarboxylase